ncbi:hypothetical protein Taro_027685 [Colocasia esculenta]|uniref:Nucleolar protein 14 n=1 Tax=Colocasia esculenta TaxID=4460 RepID=A0A843VF77_COLES|nr:hypothetical protein [Colocasia esculenta]
MDLEAHRAMEKEEDEHLVERLDKNFTSLLQSTVFLSLGQKKGLSDSADKASMQEQPDAYDKLVRVLPTDKRARPTDRKKSAEEIAQEERERLELLEEERQKRMHATDDFDDEEEDDDGGDEYFHKSPSKNPKHISGDDLGDSLYINEELQEKTGPVDDIRGNRSGGSAKDADSKSSEDSENDDDRGNDDDDDDDGGDTDGSFKDDLQNVPPAGDWEQSEDDDLSTDEEEATRNSEAENKKDFDANCNKNQEMNYLSNTRKDACGRLVAVKKDPLPFVIEAPQNLVELCSLVNNRPDEEIVEAINRIRVCNAISLSAENRRKMQVFYGVLLQYFAVLSTRNPLNVKLINLLVKPLVEMSVDTPYFAAICARERLLHTHNQFCVDIKNAEKSSWPSLKTLLLLRLWSLTFPCSDFRHIVMTPATLLICEYLMRCPIITGQDTTIGSFICSMLLSVAKQSLKFYPEAIKFLQLLLMSATGRPRSQQLNALSFMDLKPVKYWLLLNNQPSDIHPIDFFSIMSMPVDSPFFVSDNFRASVLVAVVETLHGFVNVYERLSSFPEIFLPVSSLLHEVIKQDTTPEMLRRKMASVAEHIEKKADEFQMLRQPLQMQKQKPAPIKLLNPKFEENFVKGVDYDPDRERVERKKLKKLLKKEAKGAVRELRKDNYFLHEVKEKERLLLEEERAEMYGKARAFLQEQEHAYKSGQLGKGKKRRK